MGAQHLLTYNLIYQGHKILLNLGRPDLSFSETSTSNVCVSQVLVFVVRFSHTAQVDFEFKILLSQPPSC